MDEKEHVGLSKEYINNLFEPIRRKIEKEQRRRGLIKTVVLIMLVVIIMILFF